MNILQEILAHKRQEITSALRTISIEKLRDHPSYSRPRVSLRMSLSSAKPAIIAEVKKASPSKGIIRHDFNPVMIAEEYSTHGAAAISVLTDERYFQGSIAYLESIRSVTALPLLRKDFIIDPYQLHEAKAAGADAVLLIAAALSTTQLHDLAGEARSLGLETLVEVHSEGELTQVDFKQIDMLGINNRNLKNFSVDLHVSVRVRKHVPADLICVSESGIHSADDMITLMTAGIDAFLIGESFMRAAHPGLALSDMLRNVRMTQEA